ncbi:LPS assembly lipoprotein LptE [Massilia sp. W12]|uniref:LPS-assembly lipoprotein LptE n=1 Tax=Massilia sp. W12 TaxID=3126507 RepID=UPI0030CD62FE
MMRLTKRAWGLLALCALLLSACGFQLRSNDALLALPFSSLYLEADARSPLAIELTRNLRAGSRLQLAANASQADAVLQIMADTRDKTVLSLNSAGRVREFALTYTLRFRVIDNKGRELLMPSDINLRRTISFNEAQVLAKEAEEALLWRDMQSDLVQQILRRLAAIRPER